MDLKPLLDTISNDYLLMAGTLQDAESHRRFYIGCIVQGAELPSLLEITGEATPVSPVTSLGSAQSALMTQIHFCFILGKI